MKDIHQEHSDTELQVKKHSRKSLSVLDLIPNEKMRSQSWSRYTGFPALQKTIDFRHMRNTTRQLAEVQAKLITLRQRIWVGLDDGDHRPLSWGYSKFNAHINSNARDLSKKLQDAQKKSKSCDEDKTDKKPKKKCKKQKEEPKKPTQKKKSNGIKRQTAVDWSNYDNRRQTQTIKSKSLQEKDNGRILGRSKSANVAESSAEPDDGKKKSKKKKKRKGDWEKKAKTLVNVNNFVRKAKCD